MSIRLVSLSSLLALAGLEGCGKTGPVIAPVSGTVSLDGARLTSGVVSFASSSGSVSSANLGPEGRFRLVSQYGNGIPLGGYVVTVLPENSAPREADMQSNQPQRASKIPTRYQYCERSGLTAEVKPGENEFQFALLTGN